MIRDISDAAISKIDYISKKQHKSRNQYLKEQVELLAMEPELIQKDNTYKKLVLIVLDRLTENEKLLKRVSKERGGE